MSEKLKPCLHLNLYPSVPLQLKMMNCGHFLIQGDWECTDCGEWLVLECHDEYEGREGTKTKDGEYQYQRVNHKNKMIKLGTGEQNEISQRNG